MAAVIAPVELPTGRRSYLNNTPAPDIHDPNWIPVLDGNGFKPPSPSVEKEVSPYAHASFSLFPTTQSSSPKPRPGFAHNYSKSSMAPESVTSDSRSQSPDDSVEPLPTIGLPEHAMPQEAVARHRRQSTGAASNEEKISVGTETQGDVVSAPSTDGTSSVVEERASSRQEAQSQAPQEELAVNPSTRSSMTSTRKTAVQPPTSKYNRKPVVSIALSTGRPSLIPSLPQTPQESPRLGPTVPVATTTGPLVQPLPSPKLTPVELPQQHDSIPKVQATKSSASERRQRALHSHPSNISMRSQRNSSSDDAEIIPKPPSVRHKPRKSTDSRATTPRSTMYDPVPTPAPTTPLPQLPPQARRPSTREGGSQRSTPAPVEEPVPATISNFRPTDHSEMASFMTEKNTVVFRRFDDVHVRLLLCLQDEISQLEKELLKLDSSTSSLSPSDKMSQKTKVLRELRKVVSEYGKRHTIWSIVRVGFLTFARPPLHNVEQDASQQSR